MSLLYHCSLLTPLRIQFYIQYSPHRDILPMILFLVELESVYSKDVMAVGIDLSTWFMANNQKQTSQCPLKVCLISPQKSYINEVILVSGRVLLLGSLASATGHKERQRNGAGTYVLRRRQAVLRSSFSTIIQDIIGKTAADNKDEVLRMRVRWNKSQHESLYSTEGKLLLWIPNCPIGTHTKSLHT